MLSKIDHPQYRPTRFKQPAKRADVPFKAQGERQEWRGGARVRKK